jgi:RimJ/RimL family protein N-acetyltransferase
LINFLEVTDYEIDELRNEYLKSLPEFQELYLELMFNDALFYEIIDNNELIGHAIKTPQNVLIEFYIKERFIPKSSVYFNLTINELLIKNVYCKSFDYLLLNCCLIESYPYSLVGSLFRDFHEPTTRKQNTLSIRRATEPDIPLILNQKDDLIELYETTDQLSTFIKNKNIFLFFDQDNLLGCGTIIRTHKNWNYHDIGVWVKSEFRKQGFASLIILYLIDFCVNNNWIPTCGCAIENVASHRTLERSGFISKHKLINFEVLDSSQNK